MIFGEIRWFDASLDILTFAARYSFSGDRIVDNLHQMWCLQDVNSLSQIIFNKIHVHFIVLVILLILLFSNLVVIHI